MLHASRPRGDAAPLVPVTRTRDHDLVFAGGAVTMDSTAGARSRLPRPPAAVEQLHEHIRQRGVPLVADVADQHRQSPLHVFLDYLPATSVAQVTIRRTFHL